MAEVVKLRFVTLFGQFELRDVAAMRLPGLGGEFGVLPGHASLIAALSCGVMRIRFVDGTQEFAAIGEGFACVGPKSSRLIVAFSELAKQVDTDRAHGALARAVERMQEHYEEFDQRRVASALCRAVARLQACGCGCAMCRSVTLPWTAHPDADPMPHLPHLPFGRKGRI